MIRALRHMVGALALALGAAAPAWAEPVIFAAASTRAALEDALAASGQSVTVSYAASGAIARQIAMGAPADLFISANPRWMQFLVEHGRVDPDDIAVLTTNRLVLIAPAGDGPVALTTTDLAQHLADGFFATADPDTAPVGQYGRDALQSLGLWTGLAPHLLPTQNTLATVAMVARGEAALGLAYRSDATGVDGITIAATIPADSHAQIRYLIAPVRDAAAPEAARALAAYLTGPQGQAAFAAQGFAALPSRGS